MADGEASRSWADGEASRSRADGDPALAGSGGSRGRGRMASGGDNRQRTHDVIN
jgi:hypothetical protein